MSIDDLDKPGLGGSYIYRKDLLAKYREKFPKGYCVWAIIPVEADRFYNERWKLYYVKKDDAFLLMTDNPCIHFLPIEEIYKEWNTYKDYKEEEIEWI